MSSVESLLRDLQSAVSVSYLYPRDHPRLVELLGRVVRQVRELTHHGEVSVFSVDGRLVVGDHALASSEHLARGIFTTLQRAGYHRLTFLHGLGADELYEFVDQLARAKRAAGDAPALGSSDHVRLSALEIVRGATSAPAAPAHAELSLDLQPLSGAWGGIVEQRTCDLEAIEYVALALARTIDKHAGGLIPLAALRRHDEYTVMHITNVALLAMALAEAIGLPGPMVNEIGIAALLHDVGKLSVPSEILNASGRLTEEQALVVKRHPPEGARLLLATRGAPELAAIVAYEHHIQYDGGGYPTVRRNWKLNLASAITTVADVYDALRSDRPYRAGLSRAKIRAIMTKDRGTVFAPALVDAFFTLVEPRTLASTDGGSDEASSDQAGADAHTGYGVAAATARPPDAAAPDPRASTPPAA
jgi:HD-GYP domain-containing protein (c-di-GMP phosphodiesterase class II)